VNATGSLAPHAARVALVAIALIAGTALLVRALGADDRTHALLGLRFAGPGGNRADALQAAGTNLRLAAAALIAAWAVRGRPRLRLALDATLAVVAALNLATMGLALGAYGSRLLASVALHGPLELAAFSLAGGAYLAARAGELGAGRLAIAAGVAVVLVAAGAVAETYVQIGAAR
jgi:hypothetical protein